MHQSPYAAPLLNLFAANLPQLAVAALACLHVFTLKSKHCAPRSVLVALAVLLSQHAAQLQSQLAVPLRHQLAAVTLLLRLVAVVTLLLLLPQPDVVVTLLLPKLDVDVVVQPLLLLQATLDSTWLQAKPLSLEALKPLLQPKLHPLKLHQPKLHQPKLLSPLKAQATLLKKQLPQFLRNPMRTPTSKNCFSVL